MGATLNQQIIMTEELARVGAPQLPAQGLNHIGPLLMEFGTESHKERWLGPLVRGECRSCFAMTEPEFAGSNPVWMSTTAVRDDEHYVLNGRKWFASAADGANFVIVMVMLVVFVLALVLPFPGHANDESAEGHDEHR